MLFSRYRPGKIRHAPFLLMVVIAVSLITAAASLGVTWIAASLARENLRSEQEAAQRAVAEVVRHSIDRAFAYGIPLSEIEGLTEYLRGMSERIPGIRAVEVRSSTRSWAVGGEPGSPHETLTLPLAGGEGELAVYRDDEPVATAISRLYGRALIASLAAALLAAALFWCFALKPLTLAAQRLETTTDALADDDFTHTAAVDTATPVDRSLEEARDLTSEVNARYAAMQFQAESLRAIDFDGTLAPLIDDIVARACQGRRFPSDPIAGQAS